MNKKIENLRAKLLLRGRNITSVPHTKNTSFSEILAFIGLLYLRGLLGLNNHDVAILFNDLTRNLKFVVISLLVLDYCTGTSRPLAVAFD